MADSRFFLVGLPGSGKTTLGKKLAEAKSLPFFDLDEEITKTSKRTIVQIFSENGEEGFRKLETECLRRIIEDEGDFVLATGGGTPCFSDNMKLMNESGVTIYVDTPIEKITERLKNDTSRPLMKERTLEELAGQRSHWYQKAVKTISGDIEPEALINI